MKKGYISSVKARFYRGIGPKPVFLHNLKRFNVFIGLNNAGKSTVLRLLAEDAPWISQAKGDDTLPYRGRETGAFEASLGIPSSEFRSQARDHFQGHLREGDQNELLNSIIYACEESGSVWFQSIDARSGSLELIVDKEAHARVNEHIFRRAFGSTPGFTGGSFHEFFEKTMRVIGRKCTPNSVPAILVPAIRFVGPKGEDFNDLSGRGLIDRLAELQSPDHNQRKDYEQFRKINELLQFVIGRKAAKLEIPHHREHVNVHVDNKVLPLSSLGTGVQQTVMIGAFCILNDGQPVCLEEPETHLHPTMQRKLFEFLLDNTKSQFFVATHSPSIIDIPEASVYHVENDGDATSIRLALSPSQKFSISHSMGFRASDIAQSNFVLWVEGPSDRIYIRHWIEKTNPYLHEGIHYTIMFYGGRLLSHLSVDEEVDTGFIDLLSLGRRSGIVIDSDMKSARTNLNPTKLRVVSEFEKMESFALVTQGREIENYYPFSAFERAVSSVHPKTALVTPKQERYGDYFIRRKKGADEKFQANKIRISEELCKESMPDLYGIVASVEDLCTRIQNANEVGP